MIRIQHILISIFFIVTFSNAYAQSKDFKEYQKEVNSRNQEHNRKNNLKPGEPGYRRDNKLYIDINEAGGNKNNSSNKSNISPEATKNDQRYNRVINNSNNNDHRGEGRDNQRNNSNGPSSRNYQGVIEKGRAAQAQIKLKEQQLTKTTNQKHKKNVELANANSNPTLGNLYQSGGLILSSQSRGNIGKSIFDYSTFNKGANLIPFQGIIFKDNDTYNKYKKTLAEKQLNALFPDKHNQNIADVIKTREIIRNLREVDKLIADAVFDDILEISETKVSDFQQMIDVTYLGPLDNEILSFLQELEHESQFRLESYIEGMLGEIQDSYFKNTSVPESAKTALSLLQEAKESIGDLGNLLSAANKIAKAKSELQFMSGRVEEQDWVVDLASGGVVGLTGKIAKYGVAGAIIAAEEKGLVRGVITRAIDKKILDRTGMLLPKVSLEEAKSLIKSFSVKLESEQITVIGKEGYENLAKQLNANYFHIPPEIWDKMPAVERKIANHKFIDRAIARGNQIILSHRVYDPKQVTGQLRIELDYLINEKGYHVTADGMRLIK